MSKRPSSSPHAEEVTSKKQKTADKADDSTSAPITPTETPTDVPAPTAGETTDPMNVEEANDDSNTKGKPKAAAKKTKNPPVKEAFTAWRPTVTIPPHSAFWGIKPVSGQCSSESDTAVGRASNGATNPPMWEDRKYRFKRGSRLVKYFGTVEPENADALTENLDQENLLTIHLIDMRPKSSKDSTPKRAPVFYAYDGGKPKDWDHMQAIKCLNDRRAQAIDRITLDAPWTQMEREYLASLLRETPNASIWELTERHNERFMNKDYVTSIGFGFADLSEGRTVESVSHEYKTFKPCYDQGEAPDCVRYRNDNSRAGKVVRGAKAAEAAFGPPINALEKEWDEQNGFDAEEGEKNVKATPKKPTKKKDAKTAKRAKTAKIAKTAKKATSKKQTAKKESVAVIVESESDDDQLPLQKAEKPLTEDLLEMAGAYKPDEVRQSPPYELPPDSPVSSIPSDFGAQPAWSPVRSDSRSPHADYEAGPIRPEVAEADEQVGSDVADRAVGYAEEEVIEEPEDRVQEPVEEVQQPIAETRATIEDANESAEEEVPVEATNSSAAVVVQVEQSVVATTTTIERRTSIHAARRVQLNEDYDDEEEV